MRHEVGCFRVEVDPNGVATVVFDRPPVNAVSRQVYEDLGHLADLVGASDEIRAVVLTAPPAARAWCGGADLNDFVGMDAPSRKERYAFINERLRRFYHLDRPVIAAINAHAIGIGMVLAGTCDVRVASEEARFACPEIDYGLVAGEGGLFARLRMPEGKVREMLYTGRRFAARELSDTGFFSHVVPRGEVLGKAVEIAALIARKSLPSIKAQKRCLNEIEGRTWMEAYLVAQNYSAELTGSRDAKEGVRAFLEGREPQYSDE